MDPGFWDRLGEAIRDKNIETRILNDFSLLTKFFSKNLIQGEYAYSGRNVGCCNV